MAPKLVLLASLGGSMGFKRTIMKWTLNARVTGLHPQISMKKATTLDCSITQLDSWRSSHLVGQVKTKPCWDSASHFWGCAAVVGILQRSGNGGAGPHSWVTDNFWEGPGLCPRSPFHFLGEVPASWGHVHVFKAAWTRSTAILPRGLDTLWLMLLGSRIQIPYVLFLSISSFSLSLSPFCLGTKACFFSLASPWYSVSTTDHSTPSLLLPPPQTL